MNQYIEKVAITGVGVVSPIGIGRMAFWEGLKRGKNGIKPVTLFDTSSINSKLAGEISDFSAETMLGEKGLRNLDRTTRLALCATKLALEDSGLIIGDENSDQIGVVLGSTMGSVCSISEFDKESLRGGLQSVNPAHFPNTVINSPASQISIRFNIKGFNSTVSSGFTSGLDALEYAKNFLMLKRAKAVIVGGVEELCEQTYKGFHKLGFLSGSRRNDQEILAPFDRRRNGAVLGEGASIFVLEPLSEATKRNAKIYGILSGFASCFDRTSDGKYSLQAIGAQSSILQAIKNADKATQEIDYVSASANSALDGDVAEARALASVFGHSKKVMASASKSMIGETFSAGSAFQVASACMVIDEGIIPPTINHEIDDKRCLVDCVPNIARKHNVKSVLVSSMSPTGQSSALVMDKYSP